MSNMFIADHAGWPAYDTFLIQTFSDRPVYDPNPLRPNPNPNPSNQVMFMDLVKHWHP